jgi:hypothetical protein
VRDVPEVEALIERVEKKIAELQREEKAASKSKSAFAPLTRCDVRLRIVDAEGELISLHREKLGARVEEIDRELVQLAESDGLAIPGSSPPAGSRQAQLETEETAIRLKLDDPSWRRSVEALQGRRRQIEADRELEATEQADAIVEELADGARRLAAEVAKAVDEHVRPLQERWRAIASAYMQYEQARGIAAVGRLDTSEFPIQVGPITAPIPMVLDPDHDPTITSPVPTA